MTSQRRQTRAAATHLCTKPGAHWAGSGARPVHDMSASLELDNVCVRFGRREALHGISHQLGPGVTGLVGPNGAGKTTLLRVLTGVLRPTEGRVLRDGRDINAGSVAMSEHRRSMGWLPQDARLPPRMTVGDFLSYAAWLKEIAATESAVATTKALEMTDLIELRRRRLGSLSGGQRRRAALAAAVIGRPSLLLLDEPTNGLDPVQRSHFLSRVRSLAPECIVLLATHLLEDLELVADRWVALAAGAVVSGGVVDRTSGTPSSETRDAVRDALGVDIGEGSA